MGFKPKSPDPDAIIPKLFFEAIEVNEILLQSDVTKMQNIRFSEFYANKFKMVEVFFYDSEWIHIVCSGPVSPEIKEGELYIPPHNIVSIGVDKKTEAGS